MAGGTGTGGHRPLPARQAAGCPVPGTTNRLFLEISRNANVREINPRNILSGVLRKSHENLGQAAGCPVTGTTSRLFVKKICKTFVKKICEIILSGV